MSKHKQEHNQSNKGTLSPAWLSETQDVHTRFEISL